MTIVRVGSNKQYADNFDKIFKKKKATKKKATGSKANAKKKTTKKKKSGK